MPTHKPRGQRARSHSGGRKVKVSSKTKRPLRRRSTSKTRSTRSRSHSAPLTPRRRPQTTKRVKPLKVRSIPLAPGASGRNGIVTNGSVASAIALPQSFRAHLGPDISVVPLAYANPFFIESMDLGIPQVPFGAPVAYSPVGGYLPTGSGYFAVSRDPFQMLQYHDANPKHLPYGYNAYFSTPTVGAVEDFNARQIAGAQPTANGNLDCTLDTQLVIPGWDQPGAGGNAVGPTIVDLNPVFFSDAHPADPAYLHPHGGELFCKTVTTDERSYTWLDAQLTVHDGGVSYYTQEASNVLIEVLELASGGWGPAVTPISVNVFVFKYTGRKSYRVGTFSANGDSQTNCVVTVPVMQAGYYAFTLEIMRLDPNTVHKPIWSAGITIQNTGTPSIGHRATPGLYNRLASIDGIAAIGASLCVTSDCTDMVKGGRSVGVQLEYGYDPTAYVINFSNDTLACDRLDDIPGTTSMTFAKGMYGYVKPRTADAFAVRRNVFRPPGATDPWANNKGATNYDDLRIPLHPADGWLVIMVDTPPAPLGSTLVYSGGQIHVTYCMALAFRTKDFWYELVAPARRMNSDVIIQRMLSAPQFDENPMHFSDLVSWLKGGVNTLRGIAPGILAAISGVAPEFAPIATALTGLNAVVPYFSNGGEATINNSSNLVKPVRYRPGGHNIKG